LVDVGTFVVRRLSQAVVTVLGATVLLHAAVFVMPGDPIRALFGLRRPPAERLARMRDFYHLDDPFPVQYAHWFTNMLRGEMGPRYTGGRVSDLVAAAAPVTLRLVLLAMVLQLVIGTVLGTLAGRRHGSWVDRSLLLLSVAAVGIPAFVLAFLGQQVFAHRLHWLPATGIADGLASYLMPAMVLAVVPIAFVSRITRDGIVTQGQAMYAQLAVAKGLPDRRVLWVHRLRNSMVPVVTLVAAEFGGLLTGSVVVEGVFGVPGLGGAVFQALRDREGPTVVAVITLFTMAVILVNAIADILCATVDPRIRLGRR
jgi:oligopeptide transport system permease protein